MAVYAVGDVQGCFLTLEALLRELAFDPGRDRLWIVGDLVNRGPRSLAVLRWAMASEGPVQIVLGNHDLHLVRRSLGLGEAKRRDTLDEILTAPDRDRLVDWLRRRPLVAREGDAVLVHAGFAPQWTLIEAEALARDAERVLRGEDGTAALSALLTIKPGTAAPVAPPRLDDPPTAARRALALRTLVSQRVCDEQGRADFAFSDAPDTAPPGFKPWFAWPDRRTRGERIVFGHWSALGLHQGDGVTALDTGAVWGRTLTAIDLATGRIHQVPYQDGAGAGPV